MEISSNAGEATPEVFVVTAGNNPFRGKRKLEKRKLEKRKLEKLELEKREIAKQLKSLDANRHRGVLCVASAQANPSCGKRGCRNNLERVSGQEWQHGQRKDR